MQIDEAFAKLNLVQDFIPPGNSNRPGRRMAPSFITIHNTDNDGHNANAAAHARYQKGADARARQVSWHFTVDDKAVFQSVPTNEVAFHAGSAQGNASSIGVEICMHPEMDVTVAYERAALLVAVIAKRAEIALPGGVVQHHHWSGKHCPRVLRDSPGGWQRFLDAVAQAHGSLQEVDAPDLEVHDDGHDHGSGETVWTPDRTVTAKRGLRLRAGPGTDFDTLTILAFGAKVKEVGRSGDWAMVQIDPGEGSDGFLHTAFLDPV